MNINKTKDGKSYIHTGKFTGRSPKDRFIVLDNITQNTVEWNGINQSLSSSIFTQIKNTYVKSHKFKINWVNEVGGINFRFNTDFDWAFQFFQNMTSPPITSKIKNEWAIYHLPEVECEFTPNSNCTILNFSTKEIIICGSAYTGEIKKSMFSVLNYLLPEQGILPMHCSANAGDKEGNDVALFFGLSGTGKTTLSSDPNRFFIGDDEHGWTKDNNVFNFEGGCYAKIINHNPKKEPVIDAAINKKGALFENVVVKDGYIDYDNDSITPNIRVSYPLDNIDNSIIVEPKRKGNQVKNIFFLSYDAYGVLPPISYLDYKTAVKYFELGYTSKVAGTEVGINEPQITFSPCFGAPFMPLPIKEYSQMFYNFITNNKVKVWMINTGLNGKGKRYDIDFTRNLINSVLTQDYLLSNSSSEIDKGMIIPSKVGGYGNKELFPKFGWENKINYLSTIDILKEKLSK